MVGVDRPPDYAEAIGPVYREVMRQFTDGYRVGCYVDQIDFVQVDTSHSFDRVLLSFLRARRARF